MWIDFRRQILTSKVDPRAVMVNLAPCQHALLGDTFIYLFINFRALVNRYDGHDMAHSQGQIHISYTQITGILKCLGYSEARQVLIMFVTKVSLIV